MSFPIGHLKSTWTTCSNWIPFYLKEFRVCTSRHSSLVKGLSGTDFSFPTIKTTHYCTETHNNCTELSINRLAHGSSTRVSQHVTLSSGVQDCFVCTAGCNRTSSAIYHRQPTVPSFMG